MSKGKYDSLTDMAYHLMRDALDDAGFFLSDEVEELLSQAAEYTAEHPGTDIDPGRIYVA